MINNDRCLRAKIMTLHLRACNASLLRSFSIKEYITMYQLLVLCKLISREKNELGTL